MATEHITFEATKRERAGKGTARALRREDQTPAVIYGGKEAPVTISLPSNDINVEYLKGHMFTALCDLMVDGKKHLVLARDIQLHPVTDRVMHADFLRVTEKTKIAVSVPVHFINEDQSPGLKENGILNAVRHEIEVSCLAMNIPEYIEVDIAGTEIGDTITISGVTLPKGVKPTIERDFTIATIVAPKVLEVEEEETEGEEGAEGEEASEDGAEENAEAEGDSE